MRSKIATLLALAALLAACSNGTTTGTAGPGAASPASVASNDNAYGYPASPASSPAAATGATTCPGAAGSGATFMGTKSVGGSSITIEADNDGGKFYFDPTCLKGSGTVAITIKDVGSLPHNFSITSLGINDDLTPGKSVTVHVRFPTSGSIQFFCEYHGARGMKGALLG